MSLRPSLRPAIAAATVLAATCAALAGLAGAASATAAPAPNRVGLYGSQDPSFDGVYRQSLALLALHASGRTPDPSAVTWLLAQQCADGGFQSFRTDLAHTCTAPDSTSFAGEDSNSTGIAVQALVALGRPGPAASAVTWLGAHQNVDGGWAYYPDGAAGNASDANSTSLGLSAYLAAGVTAPARNGVTPQDLLASLQVGCTGAVDERGAFTFFGSANDYATVQATLATGGGFLPVAPAAGADDAPTMACPVVAPVPVAPAARVTPGPRAVRSVRSAAASTVLADDAAGYLVRRLAANGDVVPDPFNAGATDFGSTANAVIALVATRHGSSQVAATMAALAPQVQAFVHVSGADVPGALATLTLAAHAAGTDPAGFGGADLPGRLAATLTRAPAGPSPSTTRATASPTVRPGGSTASARASLAATGAGSGSGVSGLLGGLLLVSGGGLVLAARRRGPAPRHGLRP